VVFQIVDGPVDAGELYVEATTSLAVRVVMEDGEDGADILEAAKPRVVMVDEVPVFPFDQIRRSDGDGTYTLLGVPFGAVQVIIDERPPDVFVKAINARGGQYGFSSIDVRAARSSPIEVVLSGESSRLEGDVVDALERAVGFAVVALVPRDEQARAYQDAYRTTQADAEGRFLIRGIPPGDYLALAWDGRIEDGAWMNRQFLSRFVGLAQPIGLEAREVDAIQLRAIPRAR
jgi:hypothetical protein